MNADKPGVIVKWFDEKGYGFIEPANGGRQVFFHVSSVRNSRRRDLLGQRVAFVESIQNDGRPAAEAVWLAVADLAPVNGPGRRGRLTGMGPYAVVAWIVALGFLSVVAYAVKLGNLPVAVVYVYGGMSIVTFVAYVSDKSKAGRGAWRIAESTLHGLELAGGWPGALAAQWHIGHKNRKASYQVAFWGIVALNVAALIWFAQQYLGLYPVSGGGIVVEVF